MISLTKVIDESKVSPFLFETWIWLIPSMLYSMGSSMVMTFF